VNSERQKEKRKKIITKTRNKESTKNNIFKVVGWVEHSDTHQHWIEAFKRFYSDS